MDIKTSMALKNYGISPLTQSKTTQFKENNLTTSFNSKEGIDFGQFQLNEKAPMRSDFSSIMKNIAEEAVGKIKFGEQTAIDGLNNKADAQTVVEAMANAEMTVRTATAVRDKVIEAYQEILRMPI
jgi:flagellar hook-basal body complex protein FliE